MEQRPCGDASISVLGCGTWKAGLDEWPDVSAEQAVAGIHACLDAGMNWIDTAEGYGNGRSEELVGEAIRGRAERPLVFTKVGPRPYSSGLERDTIRRAAEASLSRLGISRIDVYQVHNFHSLDPAAPQPVAVEDVWETMASLVQEGLVAQIGVSNATLDEVRRCHAIHPVASVQNAFSLLEPGDAAGLLPWLAAHDIAYLSYSPLASGLLTGSVTSDTVFAADDWRSGSFGDYSPLYRPENLPRNLEAAARLEGVAADAGLTLSDLALQWALAQPGLTAAIIGSVNPRHIESSARAAGGRLPAGVVARTST